MNPLSPVMLSDKVHKDFHSSSGERHRTAWLQRDLGWIPKVRAQAAAPRRQRPHPGVSRILGAIARLDFSQLVFARKGVSSQSASADLFPRDSRVTRCVAQRFLEALRTKLVKGQENLTRRFTKALLKRAMKFSKVFKPGPFIAGALVMACFTGCWKKSGGAIVEEKEHIDAAPTPTPEPAGTVAAQPAATPQESPAREEYVEKELAPDEIVVDTYVMKKDARGTSKDPRAYPGLEQWRIKVRMIEGGRGFTVRAEKAQFERLKVGDRVKVRYREGKYTGAVWSAEIVD